jgi:hypothetical protein
MSDGLRMALASFAAVDVPGWPGLPAALTVAELAAVVDLDTDGVQPGELGDPPRACGWMWLPGEHYAEGLRAWVEGDSVLALEGLVPVASSDALMPAPDLGAPDVTFDALLGPLVLSGGERVFAARGLAVRVNPRTGVLLGLVGFAPTSAEDYRSRLRPVPQHLRPLTTGRSS